MGRNTGRLRQEVRDIILAAGASDVSIISPAPLKAEEIADYTGWLSREMNGEMMYLSNYLPLRQSPSLLLTEEARSLFSIAFPFPLFPPNGKNPNIASYALGDDYHDVIRTRLRNACKNLSEWLSKTFDMSPYVCEFRICIDSAPVRERLWALKAGLGKRCRNGMIASGSLGSAFFLAEIITDIPLEYFIDQYSIESNEDVNTKNGGGETSWAEACLRCTKCIDACPGKAIKDNGLIDARLCISYLTIEHRGAWKPEGEKVMQTPAGRTTLFGCDICLRVCPLNSEYISDSCHSDGGMENPSDNDKYKTYRKNETFKDKREVMPEFYPRPEYKGITRESIRSMSKEDFSRLFRKSPVKRTGLDGLKRNLNETDSETL